MGGGERVSEPEGEAGCVRPPDEQQPSSRAEASLSAQREGQGSSSPCPTPAFLHHLHRGPSWLVST